MSDPRTQEHARRVRAFWMEKMGLDKDEITENCKPEYEFDIDEELEQLSTAMKADEYSLSDEHLAELARRYPPPEELFR